jgi:hypothetical protein
MIYLHHGPANLDTIVLNIDNVYSHSAFPRFLVSLLYNRIYCPVERSIYAVFTAPPDCRRDFLCTYRLTCEHSIFATSNCTDQNRSFTLLLSQDIKYNTALSNLLFNNSVLFTEHFLVCRKLGLTLFSHSNMSFVSWIHSSLSYYIFLNISFCYPFMYD